MIELSIEDISRFMQIESYHDEIHIHISKNVMKKMFPGKKLNIQIGEHFLDTGDIKEYDL